MSLIPIPWEGIINREKKIKITIKAIKKDRPSHEYNFLKFTALKFVDYVNNLNKMNEKKIDKLIYYLQKTLLHLQRQKFRLLIKKNLKMKTVR
jgi:hypothetical protein